MTTVEILRKAKAEIEQRGWTQGGWGGADHDSLGCGPCCLGIAVQRAMYGRTRTGDVVTEAAWAFMLKAIGSSKPSSWNDAVGRTKEDVLAALDRALELASSSDKEGR
jgi:hypothetical protein